MRQLWYWVIAALLILDLCEGIYLHRIYELRAVHNQQLAGATKKASKEGTVVVGRGLHSRTTHHGSVDGFPWLASDSERL